MTDGITIEQPCYRVALSNYVINRKIPPGDSLWPKFNASFINRELEAGEILEELHRGRALTTQHKNNWRTSDNYTCGQHLGLDFDAGDSTSSMPVLLKDSFISRYASFLYTTMSHTPDEPRCRVIFLLDQPIYQAKNYAMAAASLLWMFGAADRQCKDAARFFYGAPGCETEYLGNVLPLDKVKKLIADYQETGLKVHRKAHREAYRAEPEQQEVADALKLIPPWGIEYDEWLAVLMGIHSAFGEGGYALAEAWAQGTQGEVERKWRSFKDSGNGAGQVTVATVFALAKKFGWKPIKDY